MEDSKRAEELLLHMLLPLLSSPDECNVNVIAGNSTVIMELKLAEADQNILRENEEELFKTMQQILTVASAERKFSLELV